MLKFDLLKESKIEIGCHLSIDDYKVLNILYQPIIKSEVLTTYMTMYHLLDFQKLSLEILNQDLLDLLELSQNKFLKNIEKLEAIGLINTYCNEASFLYCLIPPLNSRQFFLDGILGSFLTQIVGEKNRNRLQNIFVIDKTEKENYLNITKSFDEVFNYQELNLIGQNKKFYLDGTVKNKISVKNKQFSFDLLMNLLSFQSNFFKTSKFKEFILKNAYIYHLSENDLKNILEEMNPNELDYPLLTKKIKSYFDKHNQQNVQNTDILTALAQKTLYEILSTTLGREPLVGELEEFNQLSQKYDLKNDSFNLIVLYCINKNHFTLPHINYFAKVIEDFIKHNRTEIVDILKYLQEERIYKKSSQKMKEDNQPDWLKEYINNIK